MKTLMFLCLFLCACGTVPGLTEGVYSVTLIELDNSCGWANGDVGYFQWRVSVIGKRYGITHLGNLETISCTQTGKEHDYKIYCDKEKTVQVQRVQYHVVQTVVIEPQEDEFIGNFAVDFDTRLDSCSQKAVLEGYLEYEM